MAEDLVRHLRYVFVGKLVGRCLCWGCLYRSDQHVHLADVCRRLELVNGAAVLGPHKQVRRYAGSRWLYEDAIRVALDLKRIASRGSHGDWFAHFNDGEVVERS